MATSVVAWEGYVVETFLFLVAKKHREALGRLLSGKVLAITA